MEPRQIISSGITASAIVHLSFLVLVIFFTEVHPFGSVATETIAVDLVTPEEVRDNTPPPPPPEPKTQAFDLSSNAAPAGSPPAASPPPAAAAQPAPASRQKQAAAAKPSTDRQPPAAQPTAAQPTADQSPAPAITSSATPASTPAPAYVPAQPDLSIKYHVMLGLPQDRPGDGFDAAATQVADVGSSPIAEFRRHLKTCSTLPKSITPSDKLAIKLRVFMTPEGRLGAEPVVIEGTASTKALALIQSAMQALQACQPYAMLPADKYSEWKILDLNFTPQDFAGAS